MRMGYALPVGKLILKIQLISNLFRLKRCIESRLRNVRKTNKRNRKQQKIGNTFLMSGWYRETWFLLLGSLLDQLTQRQFQKLASASLAIFSCFFFALQVLKRHEYFGKLGKIHKVVINHSTQYAGSQVLQTPNKTSAFNLKEILTLIIYLTGTKCQCLCDLHTRRGRSTSDTVGQ